MRYRVLTALLSAVMLAPFLAAGQTTSSGQSWVPPMTAWGDPDLQGQWNSQTSTPLQRPLEGPLADKDTLSLVEAEELETANRAAFDQAPAEGNPGTYNAFWRDYGRPLARTSLIIDPPDGRIPPFSAEGQKRLEAERAERTTRNQGDAPENSSAWTRCVSRGWTGIGSWYSSNYQIFQSPGYVVVFQELIHEARIIPLDGSPHPPESVTQWMGVSRGRWEGKTLVVETRNFDKRTNYQGSRDTLQLTERYTRTAENTIDYQFTVNDPHTFTRPWTVSRPMTQVTDGQSIFEYACHEGNHSMIGILSGGRADDKAAAARGR